MKCKNCGNKIPENSGFCSHCGSKAEIYKENRKLIRNIIYVASGIVGIILIINIAMYSMNSNSTTVISDNSINNAEKEEFIVSETYEINPIGFYKNSNVLDERYNENGDLIYCKYKTDNEISEYNYSYEYDNQGRVISIKLKVNSWESTLNIEYDQNNISKITTNNDDYKMEYCFTYDGEIVVVKRFFTTNKIVFERGEYKEYKDSYDGAQIIITKEINGKKYSIITELDKNNVIQKEKIYENSDDLSNNIYKTLSLFPAISYIDIINANRYTNIIFDTLGMHSYDLPIFNQEKEIYFSRIISSGEEIISIKSYDSEGKVLYYTETEKDNIENYYYKYEKIDDKTFYRYSLSDGGMYYRVLGMKSQYEIGRIRFYLDDNNEVYKYETENAKYISETEFKELEEEYKKYIEENKIDTSKIIDILKSEMNSKDLLTLIGDKNRPLT